MSLVKGNEERSKAAAERKEKEEKEAVEKFTQDFMVRDINITPDKSEMINFFDLAEKDTTNALENHNAFKMILVSKKETPIHEIQILRKLQVFNNNGNRTAVYVDESACMYHLGTKAIAYDIDQKGNESLQLRNVGSTSSFLERQSGSLRSQVLSKFQPN